MALTIGVKLRTCSRPNRLGPSSQSTSPPCPRARCRSTRRTVACWPSRCARIAICPLPIARPWMASRCARRILRTRPPPCESLVKSPLDRRRRPSWRQEPVRASSQAPTFHLVPTRWRWSRTPARTRQARSRSPAPNGRAQIFFDVGRTLEARKRALARLAASSVPFTSACVRLRAAPRCSSLRKPRVAIITTGRELLDPGGAAGSHQERDSNGPMLAAALCAAGFSVAFASTRFR
jgi:hypothetical protein